MKCLIIDDEPAARDILKQYISDAPGIALQDAFASALEALDYLRNNTVDLIFLDINMPRLSGISFLKALNNPPKVILTTAYSEYALESYELDVIDYLLKPFSFERFLKAIEKAGDKSTFPKDDDFVTIKADGKLYRVAFPDIKFVEAQGDYITVHTGEKKLTFNQTLKGFARQLPSDKFVRVHKSFLVSLSHISYLEGNQVYINSINIPIGNKYKEDFLNKFGQ